VSETDVRPSLRQRQRADTKAEIAAAAFRLVLAQGFEATTIDQIVDVVGISRRTFFHYFPTKEDVVLGDLEALGAHLKIALEARPAGESAWTALGEALKTLQGDMPAATRLALAEIYAATPSLRARHLEKHLRWQALLAPAIERRLGLAPSPGGDPRALALIAAALSCLDVAVEAWRVSGGKADAEALYLECVAAIRA
jgi:AcrR family transcriptional regulator